MRLRLSSFSSWIGDALEHLFEVAADFAGTHHGDVQVVEDLGVLAERDRQRDADLDVLAHRDDRRLELLVDRLLFEDVERAQQRQAAAIMVANCRAKTVRSCDLTFVKRSRLISARRPS